MPIKSFVEDVMYGRRRSPLAGLLLSLLSLLYGAVVRLRFGLFAVGLLNGKKLSCLVISIGNITLGGTGKTPMVIALAQALVRQGKHPVIVSRGYGRQDESNRVVVSDGRSLQANVRTGGDEPLLIAYRLPTVPVVVGSKRYEAASDALKHFKSDVVILDDGFQHLRLRRDLDLVLVDGTDPFGNGKLFPAGILREPVSALKRAHGVIITRADRCADIEGLASAIRQRTAAPIFTARHVPAELIDCVSAETKPLSVLNNSRVLAVSGIARPASFSSLLTSLGATVAAESVFPDHHAYEKTDLALVFKKAADERVNMIVTTEKDAVRLKELKPDGIWALRIDLAIIEQDGWERFLKERL